MRPQLFQQQERYFEHYAHQRAVPLSPFFFGFRTYQLDSESLALGKVILKTASGVFPDGTPFDTPGSTPPPAPLAIRTEHLGQVVYLAVPIRVPNSEETTFDDTTDSLARHAVFDLDLIDSNSVGQGLKTVQLSNLRLRLLPERELTSAWIGLALTRVQAIGPDGSITLDASVIPPVTGFGASPQLSGWVTMMFDLIRQRAQSLATLLTGSDGRPGSTAEVSDYLLLQLFNRYEQLLQHLRQVPTTSPVEVYALLLSMSGELSTYLRADTRRPLESHPPYQHTDPHLCIKPLIDDAHMLLNAVLVRSGQNIPLNDQGHGLYSATIAPADMTSFNSVVLAVQAAMPVESLKQQFIAQAKAAPPDRITDLVRGHLPGIGLAPLAVPPRQIPFNAGYVYFELSRSGVWWEEVVKHGGVALHVSGDFPALKLELWGIRV